MTKRYVVQLDQANGEAVLWDNERQQHVLTGSGQLYRAPIENVEWTALTMNKVKIVAEASGTPALADSPEEAPEPTPLDKAEARAERAHQRSLDYARQFGALQGHLSGVRAELIGLRTYVEAYPQGLPAHYATDHLSGRFAEMISRINSMLEN